MEAHMKDVAEEIAERDESNQVLILSNHDDMLRIGAWNLETGDAIAMLELAIEIIKNESKTVH